MSDYTSLKGFNSVFETTLGNELQDNIVEFFDWGLLQKGNYFNVTVGERNEKNEDYSKLSYVDLKNVDGVSFQGFRGNWVWQSGISYSPPPVYPSSIYVDGQLNVQPSGRNYKIDYYNGRITFTQPSGTNNRNGINKNSVIQVPYSYKYINVIYANTLPWLREVEYKSLYNVDADLNQNVPSEMKIQLPAIAVEIVPNRRMSGYQLGGGQYITNQILFHCIAENDFDLNRLVDIVSMQNDKTIYTFNSNTIASSGAFPIKYDGTLSSNPLRYPELINNFPGYNIRLSKCTANDTKAINSNLFLCIVSIMAEIINENI
jgi:hypothetical protein